MKIELSSIETKILNLFIPYDAVLLYQTVLNAFLNELLDAIQYKQ